MRLVLILAIVAAPILMFADANIHEIELAEYYTTGTDMACDDAVAFMDRYFTTYPAVREVQFTNDSWIPFPIQMTREQFYEIFSYCIIHGFCY